MKASARRMSEMVHRGLNTQVSVSPEPTLTESAAIASMREFYDPVRAYREEADENFINRIAVSRREFDAPLIGKLSGQEVMLVETTHALLGTTNLPGSLLPERQQSIVDETEKSAQTSASVIIDIVQELGDRNRAKQNSKFALTRIPLTSPVILAGKVMGAIAHQGDTRRTKRRYFEHPNEVASIIGMAWHHRFLQTRERELENYQFGGYTHDGYEDLLDRNGAYLNRKGILITPLVARYTLEMLDVYPPDAMRIGQSLFYLARPHTLGGRMAYDDYMRRGIRLASMPFIIPKAGDNGHNHYIEPSPPIAPGAGPTEKERRKIREYEDAEHLLKTAADLHGDLDLSIVVERIFHIAKNDKMSVHRYPKYAIDSEEVAAKAHQLYIARTAA